jgi:folate-binding protein YgfZ
MPHSKELTSKIMTPNWQNFLELHGAVIADGNVNHFGDSAAECLATADSTELYDLSQFGTLRVSGKEAQSFLQNLLSNDIREVTTTRTQLSSLNSAKGRMLASFLIWRDGADYLLQLPRSLVEMMLKKLNMYVLRAKVKVTDTSDEVIAFGIAGSNAEKFLRGEFKDLPLEIFACLSTAQGCIIKLSDTRFQIITTPMQAEALWVKLNLSAKPVGSACWDWLNIRAGIPTILLNTQEQFVAQMVNFDVIGGINFKKGCYPGQEIVARTHYLGKLKRRMYLAHVETTDMPQAGDEVFSADMDEQSSGMIVNAALAPSGGYDVLVVVQISSQATQTIHLKSLRGKVLKFLPLPYDLPSS